MNKNRWGVNRFDLEDQIMSYYQSCRDLELLAEMMYDGPEAYTADETHTALTGLAAIMEARANKLNDVFMKLFELDNYNRQTRDWNDWFNVEELEPN
jgi:hypothetical protein